MFWRILKKDLKRKKTMNIILLLFVIMCSMFAAASVNNIIAVTGGIDDYFDRSGMPDAIISTNYYKDIEGELREKSYIKDIKTTRAFSVFSSKNFVHNGKKLDNFINPAEFISDEEMSIRYYTEDNKVIKSADKGWFYATYQFTDKTDISKGDEVTMSIGDKKFTLKYAGRFKGADVSIDAGASPVIILDHEDFEDMFQSVEQNTMKYNIYYVTTDDLSALTEFVENKNDIYMSTRNEMKNNYLYDMLTAYIIMMISIVLMIAAFVVLRFTIGFTISEEFREIGVMKAMGITNNSIRRLYIVKYLAISVVGSLIGFLLSIPLSSVMMDAVSKNMVLDGENSVVMGFICSASVILIIMMFCKFCTRRIKKLSPIDAVRCGQTGERFKKKSILHLGRTKLPVPGFLAANDVVSAPKQFAVITCVFTLCMLLMTLMSNFATTLKSDRILWMFAVPESEAHIGDITVMEEGFQSPDGYKNVLSSVEEKLAENDMPGKCYATIGRVYLTEYDGKKTKVYYYTTKGVSADVFRYDEGSAPMKPDEAALSNGTMEQMGIDIGDRFKMICGDEEKEYIVTGCFTSFMTGIRLYEGFEFPDAPTGSLGLNIHFDGDPDKKTIENNVEKLKEIYDSDKIFTSGEFVKFVTSMSDTLNSIKYMTMILTIIVTSLIVILMERSFISKEKSEIALMKAVGISSRSIILQHMLRFVIVSVLACIVSSIVLMPVSNVMLSAVFSMMGGKFNGVKTVFDPVDVFVICPVILISVTVISSIITALYLRRIKANDTASIE